MKIIEIIADKGHAETLKGIAEYQQLEDSWWCQEEPNGRQSVRFLVGPGKRQAVLDALQTALSSSEKYRIVVISVEVSLPSTEYKKQPRMTKAVKCPFPRRALGISPLVWGGAVIRIAGSNSTTIESGWTESH